ncbi:RHS repeat-associated core domain-containing protein [Sorangium sp. So ce385]|uniref:RHS repeat-associated core domain-containing protein n=1 Tax=Sorangium sp. So ce385 TaxID=3133308 RepID=UPI003F5C516A
MSSAQQGNPAKGAASAAADEAQGPKPLITPTGDASLDVLIGDINDAHAAFQPLSDPEATDLDKANAAIGGTLNAVMLPITLLNDGFALATRDIGKLIELPAATLGMLHLGIPHVHLHPPAMPIPLPSFGPVALAGCASVLINGVPAARAGDVGISLLCGTFAPPFQVFTGSSKVFFGGARAARMLDITMHCMPGAGAAKAMSTLMKVVSVGAGVVGVGAEVLDAVTTAERAKRLRAKKVEPKAIDPAEAAQMTPEELAEAQADAAAEAAAEQQDNLEEAAAEEASAKNTGIQAGLDAAALALSLLMGMDPGTPPCIGAVLTGHPNVLIGGFPMPPWSAVARGLGKLGKKPKKRGPRIRPKLKCLFTGHPIDPVTGANVDLFVDFQDPDSPIDFCWSRHYTSADIAREGPMGRGFRHSYERSLAIDLDLVVYTDAEGKEFPFPAIGPGEPAVSREGYTLEARMEDGALVYEVSHAVEPTLEFVRRAGHDVAPRLARIVAWNGRAELSYDEQGRLAGMLETGRAGAKATRLSYDARGRLVEVRRGAPGERELPVIARYGYDHAGCLTGWQDALGACGSYAYDREGRIVRMTDRIGYSFHFTYDADGRCVEEHGDDGLWRVAHRYEPEKRRTLVTESDGGEWIYEYDEHGTLVAVQDPYGGRRAWILDDEGRIEREVGPDGRTNLTFLYDESGYHYGVVDRFGHEHPPLDEEPNPPNPLEETVPTTPLEQQWGADADEASPLDLATTAAVPSQRRDALGRVIDEIDPAGHRSAWGYDANGNVTRWIDRDGREHRTIVTSWDLVGAEIDPLGHQTRYEYTPREEVARVVDPSGGEIRYEYDLKDRLVRVVRDGSVFEEYEYDLGDHLIEKRDGAGNVLLRCAIGDDGLERERRLSSGEVVRYDHDARGRVTRASSDGADVRREFDEQGRLLSDERNGRGVRHRFASHGVEETIYFGRFAVAYRRAEDGARLVEAPVGGVHEIKRTHDGSVLVKLGNGTSARASYDEEGRCLGRELERVRDGKVARWSVRYTYSAESELRRVEDSFRGVTTYSYDLAHRVVGETTADGATRAIVQDAAGNVVQKPDLPRVHLLPGNRISSAGSERFDHDARERLREHVAEGGRATRYRYNSLDALVGVTCGEGAPEIVLAYDGLGRLVSRTRGDERTEYFWDGNRLAAEIGPTGALRLYVYPHPGALVPLLFIDYASVAADPGTGRIYYPIGNQIGVPLHIEDGNGQVVWQAERVDPYGAVSVSPGALVTYGLRFPGHFFDEDTGLHYNRFRHYLPRLGRYLQGDPIGQSGGINLYAYVANPLVDVDILGLAKGHPKPKPKGKTPGAIPKILGGVKKSKPKKATLTMVVRKLPTPKKAPSGWAANDKAKLEEHFRNLEEAYAEYKKTIDNAVSKADPTSKNKHHKALINKAKGANASIGETIGEVAAANYMLTKYPSYRMKVGYQKAVGLDQVWVDTKSSSIIVVEAKAHKAGVSRSQYGDQMSHSWIYQRAKNVGPTGDLIRDAFNGKNSYDVRGLFIEATPTGVTASPRDIWHQVSNQQLANSNWPLSVDSVNGVAIYTPSPGTKVGSGRDYD